MTYFHGDEAKKIFFLKKEIQNGRFSTSPKAEQFPPKFHGLVLGLVGLFDANGIEMAQPIWLRDCPT